MLSCSNIFTIAKREFKSYFQTPLAYVFIGVFTVGIGLIFRAFLDLYDRYTRGGPMGGGQNITIDRLAEAFYANMHLILAFVIPFFTMRLFTEEFRRNTISLLMTSPVKSWEVTLGKFTAGLGVIALMLAFTLVFPVFLIAFAEPGSSTGPDIGVIFSTYLGLFFVSACYMAVGLFFSSITQSQLIAVVLTFCHSLAMVWILNLFAQAVDGETLKGIFRHISFIEQFTGFSKGSMELKSFVYFISVCFFWLFLTNRSVESRSWRS